MFSSISHRILRFLDPSIWKAVPKKMEWFYENSNKLGRGCCYNLLNCCNNPSNFTTANAGGGMINCHNFLPAIRRFCGGSLKIQRKNSVLLRHWYVFKIYSQHLHYFDKISKWQEHSLSDWTNNRQNKRISSESNLKWQTEKHVRKTTNEAMNLR